MAFLAISFITYSQNVGIGITTPTSPLHIRSTTSANPLIIDGNSNSTLYSILENGTYRGYWGSFSGAAEDVDFGTGAATTGKLHLTIQASPRLTINNLGNVGIGTTSPNYKMHITGGDLFLQSSTGSLRFGYDGSNQWRFPTTGGGADFLMQTSTDGTSFTSQHYFAQNGDVGIGTGVPVPVARLDVKTNSALSSTSAFMLRNSNNDTLIRVRNNGYVGIGYNGTSYGRPLNIEGSGMNFYYNVSTYGGSIFPNIDGSMTLWAPSSSINLQPTTGAVTIGTYTAAAGYKLSINGKAICEELKVQLSTGWPDYVFNPDYNLMPIDDLEKSISINKHLPNMPSAADITADNGFEVGDMTIRLLEKVEELTLYIIELNKKNNRLSKELESVKAEFKKISNK